MLPPLLGEEGGGRQNRFAVSQETFPFFPPLRSPGFEEEAEDDSTSPEKLGYAAPGGMVRDFSRGGVITPQRVDVILWFPEKIMLFPR
jgi:hypothetical protein